MAGSSRAGRAHPGRLWTLSHRHPRWLLAAKTAVAAMLAWVLLWPIDGFVDDYPYYAPLGAVVAMSTTVVSSVRTSLQAAVAVLLGSLAALAVQPIPVPTVAGLGIVVLIATVLAGWPWLGAMGTWVPTAALFALLLGNRHPVEYLVTYAGLVTAGALVGVAVNLAFPQLPLTPATRAAGQLREEVGRQLDDLADGLVAEEFLSAEEWSRRRWSLSARSHRVDDLIAIVREGQRVNWRSRRWAAEIEHQIRLADSLVRLSDCVADVAEMVADDRASVHADDDFGRDLRAVMAEAMSAVAGLLREVDPGGRERDVGPRDRGRTPGARADRPGAGGVAAPPRDRGGGRPAATGPRGLELTGAELSDDQTWS